jgi:hypothetical protein
MIAWIQQLGPGGILLWFLSMSVYISLDHYYGALVTHLAYIYCKLFTIFVEYNEYNSFDSFLSSLLSFSQFSIFVRIVVS